MTAIREHSLRTQVEKWLAPGLSAAVHVTEFSRTLAGRKRYVCVETSSPFGSRALLFFRHDDGCWCVFPPAANRPKVTVGRFFAQTDGAISGVMSG
jgi:hypothetical protein